MDCGETSVRVKGKRSSTIRKVFCSQCGLTKDILVKKGSKPFLANTFFLDLFSAYQLIQKFETRIEALKKENDEEELIIYYSTLRNRCKAKSVKALNTKGEVNLTLVHMWEQKSLEYDRQLKSLKGEKFEARLDKETSYQRDRRSYSLPYPYIFKPPSPPEDIGVRTNMQRYKLRTGVKPFCRYCGSELSMDESFCSVCGQKS